MKHIPQLVGSEPIDQAIEFFNQLSLEALDQETVEMYKHLKGRAPAFSVDEEFRQHARTVSATLVLLKHVRSNLSRGEFKRSDMVELIYHLRKLGFHDRSARTLIDALNLEVEDLEKRVDQGAEHRKIEQPKLGTTKRGYRPTGADALAPDEVSLTKAEVSELTLASTKYCKVFEIAYKGLKIKK